MDKQREYVLRSIEDRDIRIIQLWFSDVFGFLKSINISPADIEASFEDGYRIDGSALEPFAALGEYGLCAVPQPSTFQVLPLKETMTRSARMFCSLVNDHGEPSGADPRRLLHLQLDRAADEFRMTVYIKSTLEFILQRSSLDEPIDFGEYLDRSPENDAGIEYRDTLLGRLERSGVSVEATYHAEGSGQQGVVLRESDALTAADNIITARVVAREVASDRGLFANFAPKPLEDCPGSGLRTSISLYEGDQNVFVGKEGDSPLSSIAQNFIAGLLVHAAELSLLMSQWENSYARISHSIPLRYATWGHSPSALIRVQTSDYPRIDIEFQLPDAACSPYIAFAGILAAGLRGIELGYDLPNSLEEDVSRMSDATRKSLGIRTLPTEIKAAIRAMEGSELAPQILGDHLFEFYLECKSQEAERKRWRWP